MRFDISLHYHMSYRPYTHPQLVSMFSCVWVVWGNFGRVVTFKSSLCGHEGGDTQNEITGDERDTSAQRHKDKKGKDRLGRQ